MPRRIPTAGVVLCALLGALTSPYALARHGRRRTRSYCPKIFRMPAFYQKDGRFGRLPGGGENYCAPVAVSNILRWLETNG